MGWLDPAMCPELRRRVSGRGRGAESGGGGGLAILHTADKAVVVDTTSLATALHVLRANTAC